jgi:hypothetical protein
VERDQDLQKSKVCELCICNLALYDPNSSIYCTKNWTFPLETFPPTSDSALFILLYILELDPFVDTLLL